jgi:predicted nucleic acid-binding protein
MPSYALDASTVLATVLSEAHSAAAVGFLAQLGPRDELVGPGLLHAECTSNLRTLVYDGVLTEEEGREAVEKIIRLGIRPLVASEQHRVALNLASSRQLRKAYDTHYLAVAAILGAELVTIDGGMYQGAIEGRIAARLLR